MDWPLTGALAGVTILVGVVGYGTLTLLGSGAPQTTPAPPRPVLLPSRERPAVANVSPIPDIPNAPADTAIRSDPAPGATSDPPHEASSDIIGGYPAPNQYGPRSTARRSTVGSNAPPASLDSAKRRHAAIQESPFAGAKPSDISGSRLPPEGQIKTAPTTASKSKEAANPEHVGIEEWKVITTARASYFNLGGHVDANGNIDSLASSHFRDALKKHPNYPKLPQAIKMGIEAPKISLVKLAPYRRSVGMNDKQIEEEQGIKFVRVASTRDVDLGELEMAGVPALELRPFRFAPN
jgi:hypothetical protein